MTIKEASEYSGIGINRLRAIVRSDECNFIIRVGSKKVLIKKEEFKKWLSEIEFI